MRSACTTISPPLTTSRTQMTTSLNLNDSSRHSVQSLALVHKQAELAALEDLRLDKGYQLLEAEFQSLLEQSRKLAEAATDPTVAFRHSRESAGLRRAIDALDRLIESYRAEIRGESHNG